MSQEYYAKCKVKVNEKFKGLIHGNREIFIILNHIEKAINDNVNLTELASRNSEKIEIA